MQKHIYSLIITSLLTTGSVSVFGQKVGVLTPTPQAPFHVASSGQVNTTGGLMVLGDTSEAHLEMDFNLIQSKYSAGNLQLDLQPQGGNFRIGSNLMFVNATDARIGFGTIAPSQRFEIVGGPDQYLRLHTTGILNDVGIDFIRATEFLGSDWRIVNDGGVLRFLDGTDNFLTTGDLNMVLTQAGNMGLGIDGPESHLHVAGATDQFIKVHRTTSGSGMAGIDLLRHEGNSATDWRIVNDGGVLQIRDNVDNFATAGDINMVIANNGNVGIGTESPNSILHIIGSEPVDETGDGAFQIGDPAGLHVRFDNNEILARSNDAAATLYLQYWSGALSLCDAATGRVGIGNFSPQAKLHVTDGADVGLASGGEAIFGPTNGENIAIDGDEMMARNNGAVSGLNLQASGGNLHLCEPAAGRVGIGTTLPQAKLHITDGADVALASGGQLVLGSTTGENLAFDGNEILARNDGAQAPLFLQLSGGDVLMVPNAIGNGGQVGIGVTSMANMPDDDYLLAVDGKIISEEVRVELSGSWPDYVFEEDYNLLPLPELEKTINAQGHLPGIPSAVEVENDGILLGDMQRAMMEKIEELTLYVIDLQKQIEELKKSK